MNERIFGEGISLLADGLKRIGEAFTGDEVVGEDEERVVGQGRPGRTVTITPNSYLADGSRHWVNETLRYRTAEIRRNRAPCLYGCGSLVRPGVGVRVQEKQTNGELRLKGWAHETCFVRAHGLRVL